MTTQTTPIEISNHALAARSIRQELKKAFPGISFSVKSKSYSGGSSINASWNQGPTGSEVDAIIEKFEHGSFDSSTDCYNYDTANFNKEFGSVKFTSSSRDFPEGMFETIAKDLCKLQGVEFQGMHARNIFSNDSQDVRDHVYQLLSQTSFKANEIYSGIRFKTPEDRNDNPLVWCIIEKTTIP